MSPLSTSTNNIKKTKKHWWTMIVLKNQVNCRLNIEILEHFANYEMFCKMFFSSQVYLKTVFYIMQALWH